MNEQRLIQRIEQLERKHGRLRTIAVTVGLCLLLLWSLGGVRDSRNQTVHGRRFVLVDSKGKLRAFLGADEDQEGRVGLYLYDQLGKRSAALYVKKGHSGLSLYGDTDKERARLNLGEHDVSLAFFDRSGRPATRLSHGRALSELVLGADLAIDDDAIHAVANGGDDHIKLSFDRRQEGRGLLSMGNPHSGSHVRFTTDREGSALLLRGHNNDTKVKIAPATDRPSIKLNASQPPPSVGLFDLEGNLVGGLPQP